MFAYIVFTAILNLTCGYLLCLVCLRSPGLPKLAMTKFDEAATQGEPSSNAIEADASARSGGSPILLVETAHPYDDLAATAAATIAKAQDALRSSSTLSVFSDVRHKLQSTKEKIRYAQSANDKRLAREVAADLQAFARTWSEQLLRCLSENHAPTQSACAPGYANIAQPEMFLAQIEATLSNIETLDWTESSDVLLEKLRRETELLERNQRDTALESQ